MLDTNFIKRKIKLIQREIIYKSVGEAIAQFTHYTDAVLRFLENNRA